MENGIEEREASKLRWSILSVVFVGFSTLVGVVYANLARQIEQNRNEIHLVREAYQASRERVAILETQAFANRENIAGMKADIDYIKKRIDEFLLKRSSFP